MAARFEKVMEKLGFGTASLASLSANALQFIYKRDNPHFSLMILEIIGMLSSFNIHRC